MPPYAHPVPRLPDGRPPETSSGFRGSRPDHIGVDITVRRRPGDPTGHPYSEGGWFFPSGIPALAIADGTVKKTRATSSGILTQVEHGNLVSEYRHLERTLPEGTRVRRGQPVGIIGKNGGMYHLHFGILVNGGYTDPAPFLANAEILSHPYTRSGIPAWVFFAGGAAVAVATLVAFHYASKLSVPFGRMPARWYDRQPPRRDKVCYRTKSAALNKFRDWNYAIIEDYGGISYNVSPAEFDAINHFYGLKGKRAVRNIAQALWAVMPPGRPFCLTDIDLDTLNRTSPAREARREFQLPDYVHDWLAMRQQERYYRSYRSEVPF
jgi:hypothetical protein